MTEKLEMLALLTGARIGLPDGDGHFIVLSGENNYTQRGLSNGNNNNGNSNANNTSELHFELVSIGRFQRELLESHTLAGDLILSAELDAKPETLPGIEETATGFICRSEWRILWRN
jgi:hypothetical protein